MAEIPDRYLPAWTALVDEATRRRVEIEVRVKSGTTAEDDGTVLRGHFLCYLRNRSGAPAVRVAAVETFDQAISVLVSAVRIEPLPGPDALREELRAFARKLALLTPRDVAKKSGADVPIYRAFRDRILPLAWDNLVDSVRMEALEDFVRRVGTFTIADGRLEEPDAPAYLAALDAVFAEARGLVAPKEEATDARSPESAKPAADLRPARARRSRAKPKAGDAAP